MGFFGDNVDGKGVTYILRIWGQIASGNFRRNLKVATISCATF